MSNLVYSAQMAKRKIFTATVQINDCNTFPMMVKAEMGARWEDGGWEFDVRRIKTVEIEIAGRGVDITADVLSSHRMNEAITTHILLQEEELCAELGEVAA